MSVCDCLPIACLSRTEGILTAKVTNALRTPTQSMYRHDRIRFSLFKQSLEVGKKMKKKTTCPTTLGHPIRVEFLSLAAADGCHPEGVWGRDGGEIHPAVCAPPLGALIPDSVVVWFCDIALDLYDQCGAAEVMTSAMDNEGTRVMMMETGYNTVPVGWSCWMRR